VRYERREGIEKPSSDETELGCGDLL